MGSHSLAQRRRYRACLHWAAGLMEAVVVYGVIHALRLNIGFLQAVWANGMTIAGQLFHVTPGGIGTYETTLSASLGILGMNGAASLYGVAVVSRI